MGFSLQALAAACGSLDPKHRFEPADVGLEAPFASCTVGAESANPDWASVFINEVFAGSFSNDAEDWFEIHNAGETAVDVSEWTIEDGFTGAEVKDTPGRFTFPPDTVLCPGQYFVVEREPGCEGEALDFGIGSTDQLVLSHPSGIVVDDVYWSNLPKDQSVGLERDEPGDFKRLAARTPGFSNTEECECCGECLIGKCTLRDGACVVETDADCLASLACTQVGWCALVDGDCRVTEPAHCENSELCEDKGRCGFSDGVCTVVASDDCRNAKVCENEGRCEADLDNADCIAASAADCRQSDYCVHVDSAGVLVSRKGRCFLGDGRCVATRCEDTSVCKEKACCTLIDGKCVTAPEDPDAP